MAWRKITKSICFSSSGHPISIIIWRHLLYIVHWCQNKVINYWSICTWVSFLRSYSLNSYVHVIDLFFARPRLYKYYHNLTFLHYCHFYILLNSIYLFHISIKKEEQSICSSNDVHEAICTLVSRLHTWTQIHTRSHQLWSLINEMNSSRWW
jgi:hypothetical protein